MWRRPTKSQIRAAAWATRMRLIAGRRLRRHDVGELQLPAAPRLGLEATRGVHVAMRLTRATCLERSAVLQRWYASHGVARDLVIGVTAPSTGFRAHAWLEAPGQYTQHEYTEITRRPAPMSEPNREGLSR